MKKLFILLLLGMIFTPLLVSAQNYKEKGDKAYNSGNYSNAINQYNAALAYLKSQKIAETDRAYSEIAKQLLRAEKCVPLMEKAESLFRNAQTIEDYTNAQEAYKEILAINAKDSYSKNKINQCNHNITQISLQKADNDLWAIISSGDIDKTILQQYLTEFPNGLHAKEAQEALNEIADKELWVATQKINTKEAYENYLANESMSMYRSNAEMAIYKLEDDAIWADVLRIDTEDAYNKYIADTSNPAKSHQKEASAKLSVIKTKKIIESMSSIEKSKEDAQNIVETLEMAAETITLSKEDEKLLNYYKSISDYEDFYTHPSIAKGLTYLNTYPNSEYTNLVSDKLSELYANNLTVKSTENDRQIARSYARSELAQKYVDNKIKNIQKSSKIIQRRTAWSDRAQLGIGVDAEMMNTLAIGPKIEFKLGAADNVFNFSIGAKALWWKPEWLYGEEDSYITFTQIPLYAAAKLNLFKTGAKSRFYVGGEFAYNFNLNAKIIDIEDSMLINKSNKSVSARLGFCWKHGDFSIYYRHDLSPIYNCPYIIDHYSGSDSINNALDENFRIGISYTCYIIF